MYKLYMSVYVCNQRTIRLFSYSHHEAKSTHNVVTQFEADQRIGNRQRDFINCFWYLNLQYEL